MSKKIASIPEPPKNADPSLRSFLAAVKEALEVRLGRRQRLRGTLALLLGPLLLRPQLPIADRQPRDGEEEQTAQRHPRGDDDLAVPPGPTLDPLRQGRPPGPDRLVFEELPQVVGQFLSSRVSLDRVLRQGLEQNRFKFDGKIAAQFPGRAGIFMQNSMQ